MAAVGLNPGITPDVGAAGLGAVGLGAVGLGAVGLAAGTLRTCPGLIRLGLVICGLAAFIAASDTPALEARALILSPDFTFTVCAIILQIQTLLQALRLHRVHLHLLSQ
jgi:hypothetical protein